jgi:oxygen-dependent protoporphyrinogen oxidase
MKVAIVGSGVSALACAVALKEKGVPFTVFESGPAVGGKLRTEEIDGFTVEAGPDSFLPEKYWTVDLIERVGLADDLLPTNEEHKGTYIYSAGRLHRLPEGVMLMVPTMLMPLLRSRLISWPGKLRMGMELFIPAKKDASDESLARFVTRRLGRECLEKIAEPLVAGIHTSDPDDMSVKAVFPRFAEMERTSGSLIRAMVAAAKKRPAQQNAGCGAAGGGGRDGGGRRRPMTYFMSLKGGMGQLAEGCAAFAGREAFRTSCEVGRIARTPGGYEVEAGDERHAFDAVVLSTPSYVTRRIVADMAPALAALLDGIEWSSTATVSLAFDEKEAPPHLPGFGFIVPRAEGRRINAATWSSIKWRFRAPVGRLLVRAFVGGAGRADLVERDDAEITRIAVEELREIAGIAAKPLFVRVYRWPRSMPRYTVGHLDRVAAIDTAASAYPGLYLIGSSLRGIGIGDCVKSGFEAAEKIIDAGSKGK